MRHIGLSRSFVPLHKVPASERALACRSVSTFDARVSEPATMQLAFGVLCRRVALSFVLLLLPVMTLAQTGDIIDLQHDDSAGRTGNNSLETCLRNPASCPNHLKDDMGRPGGAATRGDDGADTPDAKLQKFLEQFECGDTDAGICIEKVN